MSSCSVPLSPLNRMDGKRLMNRPDKPATPERMARIRDVLSRRQKDLTLVIDNVWDPHNVSAILRSCDAFGVLGIHLYYTTAQWPDLGAKSSASGKKWVECVPHEDPAEMIGALERSGHQVFCTGFSEKAVPLHAVDFTRPTAVILGNEHRGASPELVELAQSELYIPMQGMIPSFNVSVAAALILYEAYVQRSDKGMYDSPSLSREEFDGYAARWAAK